MQLLMESQPLASRFFVAIKRGTLVSLMQRKMQKMEPLKFEDLAVSLLEQAETLRESCWFIAIVRNHTPSTQWYLPVLSRQYIRSQLLSGSSSFFLPKARTIGKVAPEVNNPTP